jgi:metal-responsive CopG/Arc/MetJ family transcriptional regulator
VKTAISIPDEIFERAERHAADLRMSRSEFITRAIRRYVAELEAEALTGRIDAALDIAWPHDVAVDFTQHGERRREQLDEQRADQGHDEQHGRRAW